MVPKKLGEGLKKINHIFVCKIKKNPLLRQSAGEEEAEGCPLSFDATCLRLENEDEGRIFFWQVSCKTFS